ncbi:MAG: hypothetical protein KF687_02440 [Cyclobacteriaceae bacterium]|nr:hypothetical protein [Cyclobacteriaceae bacterium]
MNPKTTCCDILTQLTDLVNQLSDQEYTKPIESLSQASIGQHIRHTIEFFVCFEQGFHTGIINYDSRKHDKLIETDRFIALAVLDRVRAFVTNINENKQLNLNVSYSLDDSDSVTVETNYFRELVYNIEHAVHHMAILKIGVREMSPHLNLPDTFGIASSTVRYQQSTFTSIQE